MRFRATCTRAWLAAAAMCCALLGGGLGPVGGGISVASAEEPPDADAVSKARDAFDEGSRAYRKGKFELAASQFEAADIAVPSARAVRMAIRARAEAGQHARAATLAGQALDRFEDDAKTAKLARDTLEAEAPGLQRYDVTCSEPCVLAIGKQAVHGTHREKWVVFLDEGEAVLSASFEGGGDAHQNVTAVKGAMDELRFEPPAEAPPPKPVPGRDPVGDDSATTPGDTGSDDGPVTVDGPSWIESPWVFAVGAIATAGLGGVTIWSGIDTLDNPGTEAVKEACVGQGTECPEYQAGRSKQLRTNILIGATAGTALLTGIIGIFVTEWSSEPTAEGVGSLVVVPMLDGRSGGLSVGGRF